MPRVTRAGSGNAEASALNSLHLPRAHRRRDPTSKDCPECALVALRMLSCRSSLRGAISHERLDGFYIILSCSCSCAFASLLAVVFCPRGADSERGECKEDGAGQERRFHGPKVADDDV